MCENYSSLKRLYCMRMTAYYNIYSLVSNQSKVVHRKHTLLKELVTTIFILYICRLSEERPQSRTTTNKKILSNILRWFNCMNVQECRTLTTARMHDSCTCRSIASISQCVCLLNIRSIELGTYYHIIHNIYPALRYSRVSA